MAGYIALLRGINVSGHKMIKMEKLREVLKEVQLDNISTYIQSGNVLFTSESVSTRKLEKDITDCIFKHFGHDVPVLVVTPAELKEAIRNIPYKTAEDDAQPYMVFFSGLPSPESVKELEAKNFGDDQFKVIGKVMYIIYENIAKTRLTNVLIEKKLAVTATARNQKTIRKLVALAEEAGF